MFMGFTILSVILMVIGAIASLDGIFVGSEPIVWSVVYFGGGLFATALCLFAYSLTQVMKNCFFELHTQVQEKEANIGVLKNQYNELSKKLEEMVEKYFSHESTLLKAIKGRDPKNLTALLENYPELKAMGGTRELINQIVSLREKISYAQRVFNDKAGQYNEYAQKAPYKNLIPEGLPTKIDYIDASSN